MKTLVLFFGVLVASSIADQEIPFDDELTPAQRSVTGDILKTVNELKQNIKDAGLDPLDIDKEDFNYALVVPSIFNSTGFVENLKSTGLSNIDLTRNRFAVITRRLVVDVEMPSIEFSLGKGFGEAYFFGRKFEAEASGSLVITKIRLETSVYVRVGIFSGVSLKDVKCNFILGSIKSDLNVVIQGVDISALLNNLLSVKIPTTVTNFKNDINKLIEGYIYDIAKEMM